MKIYKLAVPALLVAALAGCSGNSPRTEALEERRASSVEVTTPEPFAASRDALKRAAQEYADAFTTGNFVAVDTYLAPSCSETERGLAVMAVGLGKDMLNGARMVIQDVSVVGSKGEVLSYKFEGTPSEAFKRKAADPNKAPDTWKLVDGKWYQADC